jgi:PEGA domain
MKFVKHQSILTALLACSLALPLMNASERVWQEGTLKDVDLRTGMYGGITRKIWQYTVEGGTTTYLAEQLASIWHEKPLAIDVNTAVKFSIDRDHLYLLGPDGKEQKMDIIKRVDRRAISGGVPGLKEKSQEATEDRGLPPSAVASPSVQTVGVLQISSKPVGAEIEIDGEYAGNTPSQLKLPPGFHTLKIIKKGFDPWERRIRVEGGDTRSIAADLENANH